MLKKWVNRANITQKSKTKNGEEITGQVMYWAGRPHVAREEERGILFIEVQKESIKNVLKDRIIEIDVRTDSEEEFEELADKILAVVGNDKIICNSILKKEYVKKEGFYE